MLAVCVTLTCAPGRIDRVADLLRANARAAVEVEPGCHRFDVARDAERPDVLFVYEVYDDEAAFAAHKTTAHYRAFQSASDGMIVSKSGFRGVLEG